MRSSDAPRPGAPFRAPFLIDGNDATAVVLDAHGTVLSGTPDLHGLVGRRLDLALPSDAAPKAHRATLSGTITLGESSGTPEHYRYTARKLGSSACDGGTWLVLLAPIDHPASWEAARVRAEQRARLAHTAALSIGASLDVHKVAHRLARVLVPDFADIATVDVPLEVVESDEPPPAAIGMRRLRRVAAVAKGGELPAGFCPVDADMPVLRDRTRLPSAGDGMATMQSDMEELRKALGLHGDDVRKVIPEGAHALIAAPLPARGRVLGVLAAWRTGALPVFDEQDAELLVEIASRGALGIDIARRYAREHRTVVTLQRSLLPPHVAHTPSARTAGTYRPAGGEAGVGGDWFDVLALSSLRTGFVVGDVVGHGLPATVSMGRLRTAVQTLADLDLEPGELLGRLDDLVLNRWLEHDADAVSDLGAQGATVLYAIHDPVKGRCVIAGAGHPPPLVLRPGREPEFVKFTPGPPLGVGGMPFEAVEIDLPAGSLLAFYTDGLVERRGDDLSSGMARLAEAVVRHRDRPLETAGNAILDDLAPPLDDDVALLLAETRVIPADSVAEWELPADPSVVRRARELTTDQLTRWGLDELAFTCELVVSELVTNAIRYGGSPVGLRLIRDDVLVCEVSDPSNSQPRLRRAIATDEGGRGLFLVAQMSSRWGSRYRRTGKTIWAEQSMDAPEFAFGEDQLDVFDIDVGV